MGSQALTTLNPQQAALYNRLRSENQRSFTPRIPEIKLAQKDLNGVKAGSYYLQGYDKEKKEKTYTSIGRNPHIVILKKSATYSYYSDSKGLIAWTSDIDGYTDQDRVVLFKNGDKGASVEFQGMYPDFKHYALKNYTLHNHLEGKSTKLLSFKTVLYVLFEDKVYRMYVPNTGVAGLAEGEKNADFKKPQLLSLTHFLDNTADLSSDAQSSMCFETVCELDSKLIPNTVDFWIMQFKKTEQKPDIGRVMDIYGQLENDLARLLKEDINRMGGDLTVKAEVVKPELIESAFDDLNIADQYLPDLPQS